ncbi:KH domain-containing protein [Candidatus Woesearchaeota archaeon]|nr:KH domain-containing protein [Candidatus Woesearchaeota archaeon]
MGELKIKDKQIVVPGEVLAEGMDYLPSAGTYRNENDILSNQIGLASVSGRVIKVIPLTGKYKPKRNDIVIGEVVNILMSGWIVDIGGPYSAMLTLKDASSSYIERGADLSQFYTYGDIIASEIVSVSKTKLIDLSMKGPGLKKLKGGRLIDVTSSKVPRIIGREGSMITMIKDSTKCRITVGQNGKVWISGNNVQDETKAVEAIMMVENESHSEGLTDKVKAFLEGK